MHTLRITALITLLIVLPTASFANGQSPTAALADPTRPAAGLAAASGEPVATRPGGIALATARPASNPAPRLQSIQVNSAGHATALLDGRVVRVGTRVGEHTVVNIDAQGMTLRGARGNEQLLTLLSGVQKTPSASAQDVVWPIAVGAKDMARKEP